MDSQDAYPRYLGDPSAYPGAEAYPVEAHMAAHGLGRAEALTAAGAAERRPVWPRRDVAFAYDEPARPLDVVHVGPSLVRGGAERWLIDLVRFLDPRRVRVLRTITTLPNTVDPVLQAAMKIPVEIGQADAVRRAARECDVLLCWGVGLNDWLADCRPRLCVFVAHGEGDWTRMVIRQSDRVIDHMVAVSRKCSERCSLGLPTTVIWNGVDSGRLSATRSRRAVRKALGFQPGDFVLGYVGRFSREKRPHVMIEAVARLPAHCKALLVGWGGLRNELMEMANEKIPGRFAFVAAWEYLGDYYQAMDALCLQSYEEGFPLAMLEGMMWARPLILRSFGCVPEVIVDRVNGLVVDGDAASVAAAAELLRRHPRWARAMGAEAKSFAETYGHAQRMARQYENLLHGLWRTKYGPLTAAVN
jgi:glycosyltransferase involved in cell wall biosynthesis